MKFFWVNRSTVRNIKRFLFLFILSCLYSCATHHAQYGKEALAPAPDSLKPGELMHRFYLVGDAGYATHPNSQQLLGILKPKLATESKNATLLYLGDNIYPLGMPPEGHKDRKEAEASLNSQLEMATGFKGNVHFIPGNHDWYHGLKGLEEESKLVNAKLEKKDGFLPKKGCGIDDVKIDDNITLITIDSQWFIEDWDNYPTINDDCTIKTREGMFTELESLLNKNQDKIVILAIHHPLMTNGTHGGQFSAEKQLFPLKYKIPLPVLGTMINLAREASGYSTQDKQSRVYGTLAGRIQTLIQDKTNVVVVSGHDHNLQYIHKDNIHQIVSGSGSKEEAAKAVNPEDFSYGANGYAILDVFKDGLAKVTYYSTKNGKDEKLFEKTMLQKAPVVLKQYPESFPATTTTSVYTPQMTMKSGFYRFLFGTHYSKVYSRPVTVQNLAIDTLYGGLTPGRAGGGHQSNSLRLVDKDGKEYVMRGIKKSATRFLQATAFKDRYVGDDFDNTFAESFLLDFYTTAHPYTPFIVDELEETAGIYHTNPELYYIPKQNPLKENNEKFGDELYMVEERPIDEFKDLASFGKPDGIDGTDDVYANLRKDGKYKIDERAYIRVRLFDMLIGDWDRHGDQWRWARYKEKDSVVYRPIPRDRDQAFPKYDGALLSILMNIPGLRHMHTFKEDERNIKWLNREPYALDLAFIKQAGEQVWLDEAKALQQSLTDEAIDKAFAGLPAEMQDEISDDIKAKLKARRAKLERFALDYRETLLKTVLITGTDKKERFVITRMPAGDTDVKVYSLKKDGEVLVHSHTYNKKQTKEIWIYGLNDDDTFEVTGKPKKPILLRLLGGQNHDTYTVENGKNIKIYDFKSKPNTYNNEGKAQMLLTNDYETNTYDPEKPKYNFIAGYPTIGYNPDDGTKFGAIFNYTVNNFNRRPFSRRHTVRLNYFAATNGFDVSYRGVFMNIASRWNFALDARFTSPNFSINYFGMGNTTPNYDDDLGLNYNRVKMQILKVAPSFFSESRNGSFIEFQAPFETIEIDGSRNRFVNQPGNIAERLFEHRQYAGVQALYSFSNFDNKSLPALGMSFFLSAGWKTSLDEIKRNFPHLEAGITFVHRLTADDRLVFASSVKTKLLFNNNFEFYQAATLGGDLDLRGYRRERFTGKQSVYHSTDLRFTIGKWKSSFVPLKYGILGGYDYGRVWLNNDTSNKWHQSAGGGLWLNAVDAVTARVTYFRGSDGGRMAFGLTFGF
ncbi:metallophosphoesterase [Flavobacterium subsaxonicum]|uniref:Metallophosphoesterase n=1 Tax=Flavobacterium subsaxonicum WB 4.1-42 = DSM 21790 TaxID=1121898 RepID=A0A0A2MRW4_9FLAO|nr:metallophosphoesterase [Flavobacterium subsaxonicum]KGO94331.1 metallophosphoesterase [Flavobacterium subsaxonicum WB 4.1-42 = DSM 21790]